MPETRGYRSWRWLDGLIWFNRYQLEIPKTTYSFSLVSFTPTIIPFLQIKPTYVHHTPSPTRPPKHTHTHKSQNPPSPSHLLLPRHPYPPHDQLAGSKKKTKKQ